MGGSEECENLEGVEAVPASRVGQVGERCLRVFGEVCDDLRRGSVRIHTDTIDARRDPHKYVRIRMGTFSPGRGRHKTG